MRALELAEAARLAGNVSRRFLEMENTAGRLRFTRIGRRVVIIDSDLDDYLTKAREISGTSEKGKA